VSVRTSSRSAPHEPYFARLERDLSDHGPGRPAILLDLDALDHNLAVVRRRCDPTLGLRVVAKSLPSLALLRYVGEALDTERFMVFDDSLAEIARELPTADLLLGKPMPLRAAARFLERAREHVGRVAWLVDDEARLLRYLELALREGVCLGISIEIDIGLRRGGLTEPAALLALLRIVAGAPGQLRFVGLMGYDAHVGALGAVPRVARGAHRSAIERYAAFVEVLRSFDARWAEAAIFNGAGSKTYASHHSRGPLSEVALGSGLVMPTDFDVPELAEHRPAVFLAVPVLKRIEGTVLPMLDGASRLWARLDPNRELSYALYGGRWLARPWSPKGLVPHPVHGSSTNQSMWSGSRRTGLEPEGTVFFRPTQSERVMSEHGPILLVRDGRISGAWDPLPLAS
jgi:D-serine deaminase-like pyridoxal phosphate-dependent protein